LKGAFPTPPDPRGIVLPCEAIARPRSRYSVRGSRHVVSTTARSSGETPSGAKHRKLPWTWTSLQGSPKLLRRSLAAPTTLLGFLRPYSDISEEVHGPGLPHPVRSAFRVSHPLDGFLPPAPSDPEGPVPLMGFTLQSLSPSRSCTPFDADALLPFLASRSPALRTRRPRCPAASGRCSPRGSVPVSTEADGADALLGFCASPERSPHTVEPASRLLPSCALQDRPRGGRPCGAPRPSRAHG
jgi:hypothetical protein